jgi:hypothetical protein
MRHSEVDSLGEGVSTEKAKEVKEEQSNERK